MCLYEHDGTQRRRRIRDRAVSTKATTEKQKKKQKTNRGTRGAKTQTTYHVELREQTERRPFKRRASGRGDYNN